MAHLVWFYLSMGSSKLCLERFESILGVVQKLEEASLDGNELNRAGRRVEDRNSNILRPVVIPRGGMSQVMV